MTTSKAVGSVTSTMQEAPPACSELYGMTLNQVWVPWGFFVTRDVRACVTCVSGRQQWL